MSDTQKLIERLEAAYNLAKDRADYNAMSQVTCQLFNASKYGDPFGPSPFVASHGPE